MFEASSDDYYPTCAIPFPPFFQNTGKLVFKALASIKDAAPQEHRPYKSFLLEQVQPKESSSLHLSITAVKFSLLKGALTVPYVTVFISKFFTGSSGFSFHKILSNGCWLSWMSIIRYIIFTSAVKA
ncbi:hypothetical protein TNCV_163171 [Trichonephila clavipes]|nr:hypothetical protein TNCV_163171 [Trichonephila clavipes]